MIVYKCSRCGTVLYVSVANSWGLLTPYELRKLIHHCPRCGKVIETNVDRTRVVVREKPTDEGFSRWLKSFDSIAREAIVRDGHGLMCRLCNRRVKDVAEHIVAHHLYDVVLRAYGDKDADTHG